ncbi:MAG: metal-dependent hydrolase [Saprospiraceae bacterium]|nr:metal-dependent hydrolase [Saprospiraceae bacterium]
MDSLTQIVLGAAVGEVVLGKKVGNRAMLWGGIAGTIPDLDIILGPFVTEIQALAMHRGFSHSITFSIIGAFLFGWLVYQMYKSPYYKWIAVSIRALFFGGISIAILYNGISNANYWPAIIAVSLIMGVKLKWMFSRYVTKDKFISPATLKDWQLLFFWGLFTHIILDCFTMYGTQVFAPFSDYRVAFSTISVADPLYTAPFIICLIVASFLGKDSRSRRKWNYAGLIISSLYLCFTVVNKQVMNSEFSSQLAEQNIEYKRCISGPTILNNILWSVTVDSDSVYYQGQYSWFDRSPVEFKAIDKNYELINGEENDPTVETLKWFSKDFYNIIMRRDGRLQFNDLRYGTFRGGRGEDDFIFRFILEENNNGGYEMMESEGGPPKGKEEEMMQILWSRIKGI